MGGVQNVFEEALAVDVRRVLWTRVDSLNAVSLKIDVVAVLNSDGVALLNSGGLIVVIVFGPATALDGAVNFWDTEGAALESLFRLRGVAPLEIQELLPAKQHSRGQALLDVFQST
jgi:hypothetical protein